MSTFFSLITVRAATAFPVPFVSDVIALVTRDESERKDQYVRDNVLAMTRKLGEVQAQLLRLDVLGERVAKAAGIRPEEFRFRELPGRGGALGSSMSLNDLDTELQRIHPQRRAARRLPLGRRSGTAVATGAQGAAARAASRWPTASSDPASAGVPIRSLGR